MDFAANLWHVDAAPTLPLLFGGVNLHTIPNHLTMDMSGCGFPPYDHTGSSQEGPDSALATYGVKWCLKRNGCLLN